MTLAEYFPAVYIINRIDRTDRWREMNAMLNRVGWPSPVHYFPAVVPAEPDGFPSAACRGCYLSHLGVLEEARVWGLPRVLILEDDCEIDPGFVEGAEAQIAAAEESEPWGIWYLGHDRQDVVREYLPGLAVWSPAEPVRLLHCYAVSRGIYDALIDFLHSCLLRPPGHAQGGPQFPDGAINMFRAANPYVFTLLSCPALAWQRSSRSDVSPSWFDRLPALRGLVGAARWLRQGWRAAL